ncbi:MAG TPA: phosphoribosylformylglycinamidine synthase, purS protein [Hadesarchaea archaeon]|nr:phosphoribosylformylglycinamidine synthase, purS protein [Hadesarchaea archaeon]
MELAPYHARIEVKLKPGYIDPEGETARKALVELRYDVKRVGTAKVYELDFMASSIEDAKKQVEEMCRKLLSNPVKDDYVFEVKELK